MNKIILLLLLSASLLAHDSCKTTMYILPTMEIDVAVEKHGEYLLNESIKRKIEQLTKAHTNVMPITSEEQI